MITREQWEDDHKCCPHCGSRNIEETLIGIFSVPGTDFFDGKNKFRCHNCGEYGKVCDLVREKEKQ